MAYIIGSIVALMVGVWLIVSAFHLALTILGWVLVVAGAAALVKYLMGHRGGSHHGTARI